jgi:hypothetical protein
MEKQANCAEAEAIPFLLINAKCGGGVGAPRWDLRTGCRCRAEFGTKGEDAVVEAGECKVVAAEEILRDVYE